MGYGTWGGRFPIVNLLGSRLIRAMVAWRLISRRWVNKARGHSPIAPCGPASAEALRTFLSQGYNRLNLGGGRKTLDGFVNIDIAPHDGVPRQVVADILDLSFVPDGSIAQIHSNHVIEHVTEEQWSGQLQAYRRMLRPGGLLTLRCPNALGAAYGFWLDPVVETDREAFIALGFPPDEDFGNLADGWMHHDLYGLLHWLYGDMGHPYLQHARTVTPTGLRDSIESAGFTVLKMSAPEAVNTVAVSRLDRI
jgi:hypothetical protein